MTRPLDIVSDEASVFEALKRALEGGPAVAVGAKTVMPATVEQRIALVVETSGSTGAPKRVALSANALLASAAASASSLGGAGQWLLALPTHYIAGINVLVRSIAAETTPVVLPPGHFDAAEFVATSRLMDAPLRFTALVPVQLARLVEHAEHTVSALEELRRFSRILVGGQASSAALIDRCAQLGLNVARTYGSSETSGGCVYDGVPIGAAEVRIVDGEAHISGPMLAEGYLGDTVLTEKTFVMADGRRWYRTGDTATLHDGVLTVTGRLDSVIISGGEKVSLEAIEQVIRQLDGLTDAVVVRAPSAEWGEVPVVFSSGLSSLREIKDAVVAKLSKAHAPVAFIRVETVPTLASGKPDRVGLTAFAATRSVMPPRPQ